MKAWVPTYGFETAVRSATQFFAALIGFILSHLLDARPDTQIGHRKLFFLFIAICLVLRFFFGSANHLWLEYGIAHRGMPERKPNEANWLFIKDVVFLIFFAMATGMLASGKSRLGFFQWSFILVFVAALWNLFHKFARKTLPQIIWSYGNWRGWLWINVIQTVLFGLVWIREIVAGHRMPLIGSISLPLWLGTVAVLSFVLLVCDLRVVLRVTRELEASGGGATTPTAPSAADPALAAPTTPTAGTPGTPRTDVRSEG